MVSDELTAVIALSTPDGLVIPELYTKHDVATVLGIGTRQVERLIAAGRLGSLSHRGRRYVTREHLETYVRTNYRQPELVVLPQRGKS